MGPLDPRCPHPCSEPWAALHQERCRSPVARPAGGQQHSHPTLCLLLGPQGQGTKETAPRLPSPQLCRELPQGRPRCAGPPLRTRVLPTDAPNSRQQDTQEPPPPPPTALARGPLLFHTAQDTCTGRAVEVRAPATWLREGRRQGAMMKVPLPGAAVPAPSGRGLRQRLTRASGSPWQSPTGAVVR